MFDLCLSIFTTIHFFYCNACFFSARLCLVFTNFHSSDKLWRRRNFFLFELILSQWDFPVDWKLIAIECNQFLSSYASIGRHLLLFRLFSSTLSLFIWHLFSFRSRTCEFSFSASMFDGLRWAGSSPVVVGNWVCRLNINKSFIGLSKRIGRRKVENQKIPTTIELRHHVYSENRRNEMQPKRTNEWWWWGGGAV